MQRALLHHYRAERVEAAAGRRVHRAGHIALQDDALAFDLGIGDRNGGHQQPYQFDFYDGGGLDLAFLSFAQVDRHCNVNVSRFGGRIIGPGGFINISKNARTVVFSGTFTAGGVRCGWPPGRLRIELEGREQKFVLDVEQVSYSGRYAMERGQRVLYVTERAVFRATADGLELVEIGPGADLERDVIGRMGFRPCVSPDLKSMDPRLFDPATMDLARDVLARPPVERARRLAAAKPS